MQWHLMKLMLTNFRWLKFIEFVLFVCLLNQEKRRVHKRLLWTLCVHLLRISQSMTARIRTQVT